MSLDLGLEAQVLGLHLNGQVLGLGLCVLDSDTATTTSTTTTTTTTTTKVRLSTQHRLFLSKCGHISPTVSVRHGRRLPTLACGSPGAECWVVTTALPLPAGYDELSCLSFHHKTAACQPRQASCGPALPAVAPHDNAARR